MNTPSVCRNFLTTKPAGQDWSQAHNKIAAKTSFKNGNHFSMKITCSPRKYEMIVNEEEKSHYFESFREKGKIGMLRHSFNSEHLCL